MEEIVFRGNDNQALTTSAIVAEKFGKEHSDVLKAIRALFTTGENHLSLKISNLQRCLLLWRLNSQCLLEVV